MNRLHLSVTDARRYARLPPTAQRGLTIVELMISLGLGLLLIAAVGAVYLGNSQTYRAAEDSARTQETGRYALDVIGRSLRQAGYAYVNSVQGTLLRTFTGIPVSGLNGVCPTSAPTTDVITTQYDGTAGEVDCQGTDTSIGKIVQHTFFIQDNTLRCDAVQRGPGETPYPPAPPTACPATGTGAPLLDNVEDLQVLYGIDTTSDGSADSYTATPGNWNQVVSARVCVLVRSASLGSAPAGQRYFNCSGALGVATSDTARFTTATDTRLRRAFVATITLRNRITAIP